MGRYLQDLKFAVRMLWRSRTVSILAILAVALGMAATTSVFSVVNGVLLRPLPWRTAESVVVVRGHLPGVGFPDAGLSVGEYVYLRDQREVFDALGIYEADWNPVLAGEVPRRLHGGLVSAETFPILGVSPAMGRALLREDEVPGSQDVVLVSHAFWKQELRGDPEAVGRVLKLDGNSALVVGVMPADFVDPQQAVDGRVTDLWAPLTIDSVNPNFGSHGRTVYASVRSGVSREAVNAHLSSQAVRIATEHATYSRRTWPTRSRRSRWRRT